MGERMRFVIRLKDGESMAALCREFQISRKTGYKIFERYERCGLEVSDRTRRPFRCAKQLPEQMEAAIVTAKRESRAGALARSASACCGACRMPSRFPPPALSMPCWTAMAW